MKPIRILILSVLSLTFAACDSPPSSGGRAGTVSVQDLNTFATRAGLTIPPTATATFHKEYFGMDELAHLILEIPTADLDPFMKASALEADITNTTRASALAVVYDFAPKIPTKFREGQKSLPGDKWLNVLVDEDSPTTAVIYLCWFGV